MTLKYFERTNEDWRCCELVAPILKEKHPRKFWADMKGSVFTSSSMYYAMEHSNYPNSTMQHFHHNKQMVIKFPHHKAFYYEILRCPTTLQAVDDDDDL